MVDLLYFRKTSITLSTWRVNVGAQTNAKQFFPAIVLKIAEGVANTYFGLGE